MAAEISYQFQALLNNGQLSDSYSSGAVSVDQSTAKAMRNTQTIGFAADEALDLGDVTTPGVAMFINLDDTNYVEVGVGSFSAFVKLKPGEKAILRLATTAPRAKADTAAVELFYIIYND